MKNKSLACAVFLGLASSALTFGATPAANPHDLKVYFVDVEGGQATLFVTPEKKSLLIDTGWAGNEGRDADRIVAAAKLAGIFRINYVLITHYHADHVGGVPQLAARIPVDAFIDHGENRESGDADTRKGWQAYRELLAGNHYQRITSKPGDALSIGALDLTTISADGALIAAPLPSGGAINPYCKDTEQRATDQTENPRSLGTLLTFGKLRILDLGDLTWDKERELMCPINKLGHVDVYIVSHHGWQQSGSPALVWGIDARVAIMDNGAQKGGSPLTWDIIKKSPHLQDLWQLHYSEAGGAAHNVAAEFVANPTSAGDGRYLELTARLDGSFEIYNSRTRASKSYPVQ
jgi:competence protein ComEC